jgi:hypothetical protein
VPQGRHPGTTENSDNNNGKLRLRDEECSKHEPCDRCQGDCDDDNQCRGSDLLCFKRGGDTRDSPVPGCTGDAVTGENYTILA